ncbi:hypothetical protein BKA62DRAFT_128354 [Auriculariales sp. MPI-PUGE-AT-0066]|nr:hypothetical protein BKA62DRAFT_128354 [Auriculariales sp. MPI-PUGE-AT-0066]
MRLVSAFIRWRNAFFNPTPVRHSYTPIDTAHDGQQPTCTPRTLAKAFIVVFALAVPATILYNLAHSPRIDLVHLPDVPSLRVHESKLPQHNDSYAQSGRFVRFLSQHHWGEGFNNAWEEFILLAEIARRAKRAYVFRDLVFKDNSEWPFTAFMGGPIAGGPWPPGEPDLPAVSMDWYQSKACPRSRRTVLNANNIWFRLDLDSKDAETIVIAWADLLLKDPNPCIDIEGRGFFSLDLWFGRPQRAITIWPILSKSPLITHHAWSNAVYTAVTRNLALITHNALTPTTERHSLAAAPSADPPLRAHTELARVLALHIRRGDYEGHCWILAHFSSPYASWNVLPGLPDTYTPATSDDDKSRLIPHCLPDVATMCARVEVVLREYRERNPDAPKIEEVYLMTNADDEFVQEVRRALVTIGLERLVTTKDLALVDAENFANMVIDMEIGIRAALFIGNGFSTFTSTIVALRDARGAPIQNSRFW